MKANIIRVVCYVCIATCVKAQVPEPRLTGQGNEITHSNIKKASNKYYIGTNDVTEKYLLNRGLSKLIDGWEAESFLDIPNLVVNYVYECKDGDKTNTILMFQIVYKERCRDGVVTLEKPRSIIDVNWVDRILPLDYEVVFKSIAYIKDAKGKTNSILLVESNGEPFKFRMFPHFPAHSLKKYEGDYLEHLKAIEKSYRIKMQQKEGYKSENR